MPGLLDTDDDTNFSSHFWIAVAAEWLGVLIFAFLGGAAPAASAAWANGIALAVLGGLFTSRHVDYGNAPGTVYATANASGGHLNPAVTIATVITGDTNIIKGALYIVVQIMALIPNASDVGCFAAPALSLGQLFGWETIMTFVLVSTVYSVAMGEPTFGNVGPLAVGLSLFASAIAGGGFTGAALNPARVLGPAIVWGCNWGQVPTYIFAELVGGAAAGLLSGPLYGWGPFVRDPLGRRLQSYTPAGSP